MINENQVSRAPMGRGRSTSTDARSLEAAADGSAVAQPKLWWLELLALLGLNAVWAALMQRFEQGGVYWYVGGFALFVGLTVGLIYRQVLGAWLRPQRSGLWLGLATGVGMTLLTYPVYELAAAWVPALEPVVAELYSDSRQEPLWAAFLSVLIILTAEELLWRGAFLDVLRQRLGPGWAGASSVLLYTLGQLGSGSFIVAALAVGCGAVWTFLRIRTGSLWAPFIAHLIWTPIVLLFFPVVG